MTMEHISNVWSIKLNLRSRHQNVTKTFPVGLFKNFVAGRITGALGGAEL